MMTIDSWLHDSSQYLKKSGIETAQLDVLVILEDQLSKDRSWILSHPEIEITSKIESKLKNLLNQRSKHTPLAYILGRCEFYGREFVLTPDVLQPRPESETIIDVLKKHVTLPSLSAKRDKLIRIADVGTGSGALGITAALEVPNCEVDLIEIDKKAAKVAQTNVDLFTLNISVIISDLLENSSVPYDIIMANLPYVPDNYQINLAATKEPRLAIFGGKYGLEIYRKLFKQISDKHYKPLLIITESMPAQHSTMCSIAIKNGYAQHIEDDFIQAFSLI